MTFRRSSEETGAAEPDRAVHIRSQLLEWWHRPFTSVISIRAASMLRNARRVVLFVTLDNVAGALMSLLVSGHIARLVVWMATTGVLSVVTGLAWGVAEELARRRRGVALPGDRASRRVS